jgi:8-oxo-dGTP pyrophosphatase MutT (NUDIX family)
MIDSYKLKKMNHAYMRPRDAATLIVVDRSDPTPRILMGKRHENHRFMPGKFVFPGGRVDMVDSRIKPLTPLAQHTERQLSRQLSARAGKNKPQALALAAIREMFEETGLLVGREVDTPMKSRASSWQAFFDHKVMPALDQLTFIARAVTPPGRPRRFDTRFFMCDINSVARHKILEPSPTNELLELNWLTKEEALDKDLAHITQVVLGEVEARLNGEVDRPIPYYFQRGSTIYRHKL